MFSGLPRGSYLDAHISKSYGKEVLLAHWQELRAGNTEKSDCIAPALKRVDKCENHLSEQKNKFGQPWKTDAADEATRHFRAARIESFNNLKRNRETQVRFPLTAELSNNFTTTYTIMHEIAPKEYGTLDLLQSYGNRSRTNKRCEQKQKVLLDKAQRLQTSYDADFNVQPAL